ncbi:MAG: UvrB/UvrC motif-containing protein [Candidatus Eisenbacteria bacterium]|uniref:UvrB/UvrC motif-containing protein n=1 Tax=Eiseniibacteriota bacterium TaxID=2212470 RepID=A0A9D6L8C2_UNCEI|nr:UvrB/UvrC motif-containing protein [Candidatus Eisenbacteria bacterium]
MLCQICGKNQATVHFTEIHDNKMSEIHVCERCAEEKGLQQASQAKQKFDLADKIAEMVDSVTTTEEERVGHVQCPRCGLLYSAFKETGRLGCAECYQAFQFQLRPLLRRIHGDTRHRGKAPARDGEGVSRSRQMQRLHDELQRAVEREEFERAAELRDEIQTLEREDRAQARVEKP